MNKEQKTINEIISKLETEDVKREDLEWECTEEFLQNQSIPEYNVFLHEDEYMGIYQESKYYNPFLSKENTV